MNLLTNRATEITINWITSNNLLEDFKQAESVDELKKMIYEKLKYLIKDPMKFAKGARITNWETVYKLIQNSIVLLAFFLIPLSVKAETIVVRYTIKTGSITRLQNAVIERTAGLKTPASHKLISPTLMASTPGDKSAGGFKENSSQAITRIPENASTMTVEAGIIPQQYVISLIEKYFGNEAQIATAIARAESGLRCDAIGDGHLDPKSYGVFQIRGFATRPSPDALMDCETNIRWAYGMYQAQGWYPWSAYTNGSYLKFL